MTASSSIPSAFSYAGQQTSTALYDLTPYQLTEYAGVNGLASSTNYGGVNVVVSGATANLINSNYPLIVTVTGYQRGNKATASYTVTSNALTSYGQTGVVFDNVTNIGLNRALPGLTVTANAVPGANAVPANQVTLAVLSPITSPVATLLYQQSGNSYYTTASGASLIYNQQNGQTTQTFQISAQSGNAIMNTLSPYYSYTVSEYSVPASTTYTDSVAFNLVNSTAGLGAAPLFQLNYSGSTSVGTRNNVTYTGSGGSAVNAQVGFRTERGSKVASISPSSLTLNIAKSVDTLQFVVGGANTTTSTTTHTVGPYGVGQATNIANVTIANVTGSCSFTTTSCNVSGVNALSATPSVTTAVTPVKLDTSANPLAVLDTQASTTATLVVVGSKYVNTVAAQIFAQNPTLDNSFGPTSAPIAQAYGSNRIMVAGYSAEQTVTAGNQFIQDLLSAASQ
ncbi:Uncharacterised protein [uncultured archaeon]|nr:Uncharacterised protein [uncultured archaeon]